MKEQNEQKEKKKRKRLDKDTAGVILILAILILAAVIAAFMGYHNTFEKISKAASKAQNNSEDFQFTVEILLTCGFVAVFVICLIVLKKMKDRKRNALLLAKRLEQEQKLKKLEDAKERVRRASMDSFFEAGQDILEKRKREEQLLARTMNKNRPNIPEHRGMEGEYVRRDLNAYKDEDYEDARLGKPGKSAKAARKSGIFSKIINWFRSLFKSK